MASRASHRSCSHPNVAPVVMTFDPKGDMFLVVGKHRCSERECNEPEQNEGQKKDAVCFHVNSEVLAGASPAFGMVLYSPTFGPSAQDAKKDNTNNAKWNVDLPDDDPRAMLIVIDILYGHYGRAVADRHMDIRSLVDLTRLADKYDLVHLFRDWSAQWVLDMAPYWVGRKFILWTVKCDEGAEDEGRIKCKEDRDTTEDLEALLWISWVLGHEPLYAYMILQIASYSELDAAGTLTDPCSQLMFGDEPVNVPVPPCAPIEIGYTRIEMLRVIRRNIKDILEGHLGGKNKNKAWLQCNRTDGHDDRGWRRSVLRLLVEKLETEGLWPLPTAYELTASPRGLVETFRLNPNIPWFVHRQSSGGRFCHAVGTFWERIEHMIRTIRLGVPAASTNRLGEQAVKSGLADYFQEISLKADKGNWNMMEVLEFQEAVAKIEAQRKPREEQRQPSP